MKFKILFLFFVFLMIPGFIHFCPAQSYGLGFDSYEVVQDKRTGLDLSPDNTFCFNNDFVLSFELSFLSDKKTYFGYIVRLIENDKQNIDLIYDNSTDNQHFKLVIGDTFSRVSFDFPNRDLYKKWNKVTLKFNKQTNNIQVIYGDKSFSQPVKLSGDGCFKVLFGANQYKDFKSTDVPPMKIRNIAISEDAKIKFRWPLDETDGIKATEEIQEKDALAANPVWIKKLHYEWQLAKTITLKDYIRVGFDENKGVLHIVGKDSLISYQVAANKSVSVKQEAGTQPVYVDNQLLFDKLNDKLYHIYIDEKQVSTFDFKTNRWDKSGIKPVDKTHFIHANKFYSPSDSAVYLLGGYGHLSYKKNIQRYHVPSKTWTDLHLKDSLFTPRYLAALGAAKDGAYILGGYGSSTGQQMLNPRNWYDLLFFNAKTRMFRKLYELKLPKEDFVFSNSMIIHEKDNSFYTLIFPKDKFNSELQLIKGSLTGPDFKMVGSKIPYQFVDIQSYADLFFDYSSNRFVAVTLYLGENNLTKVSVYYLNAPPLESVAPVAEAKAAHEKTFWLIGGLLLLGALAYVYLNYYKKKKTVESAILPNSVPAASVGTSDADVVALVDDNSGITNESLHSSIFLFGNLQLFDEEGNEITKQFSPLVKELFLVILLYSIRWEGISSEKLKELLWFDKPSESARNNRSVNIAKLKGILDKMKYCQVSKETGYWKIKIDYEKIHVDYTHYLTLIRNKKALNKQSIMELADITKRGNFLSNVEYEWLDTFKSEISNEIVDTYLRFAATIKIADDPEFLVKLANYVFYFDPVNEEAMIIKCKALAHLGKHSLAKTTYENFAREYNRIYGEDFQKDMPEVLHS
ncbi:galactose oxidase [Dyadobacter sp. LHD-138]|uniref:galactose oxidase n=1 Tax=Dyadobacter sp. LHD-138 TaxID=3071413 RepID=UPI0027E05824|nr:galactose oxidase [Dyadobacter sp. LHD-138]MDQ6478855.1 galactose oxidase [Dyadobacter sp. LHD-138]